MTLSSKLIARLGLSAAAACLTVFPAAAMQDSRDAHGGSFLSAPEIEIALVSSAILVAGGAALILRDRKARRQADKAE